MTNELPKLYAVHGESGSEVLIGSVDGMTRASALVAYCENTGDWPEGHDAELRFSGGDCYILDGDGELWIYQMPGGGV